MDIKELMEVNPQTLAEVQHKELKRHTLEILNKIASLIENENYDEIQNHIFYSPAGDGHGSENYYINFDYKDSDEGMDIDDMLYKLNALKEQIKK